MGELDVSDIILEPSGNEHPEADEIIEENRDSINRPSTPPSEQVGSEDAFSNIPNQLSSAEGVLNLESKPSRKQLPHHTRGIPKPTYEPEPSSKVRYPISNYVSNHHCLNQISHL